MCNKINYSDYNYTIFKIKKECGLSSINEVDSHFDKLKSCAIDDKDSDSLIAYEDVQRTCAAEYDFLNHCPNYYFIESLELLGFLQTVGLAEITTQELLQNLPYAYGVLCFPRNKIPAVFWSYNKEKNEYICSSGGEDYRASLTATKDANIMNICNDNTSFKVLLSFFVYCQYFTGVIKEGIPGNLKKQNHFKKFNNFKVTENKEIFTKSEKKPHVRRYHFRYLKSDRYKNKKGCFVFVRESFIKGKANTVINKGVG